MLNYDVNNDDLRHLLVNLRHSECFVLAAHDCDSSACLRRSRTWACPVTYAFDSSIALVMWIPCFPVFLNRKSSFLTTSDPDATLRV